MHSIQLIKLFMHKNKQLEILEQMEEKQNIDYEGMTFTIDNTSYRSRLAKLTPKKKGYFVAFWEKNENNINQAFSFANCPDKVVITIIDKQKKGLFIFPKEVLKAKKILRTSEQKGKMALRVYPTWLTDLNPTATKTQKWQAPFFFDMSENK